jgi:hypothetical protein
MTDYGAAGGQKGLACLNCGSDVSLCVLCREAVVEERDSGWLFPPALRTPVEVRHISSRIPCCALRTCNLLSMQCICGAA